MEAIKVQIEAVAIVKDVEALNAYNEKKQQEEFNKNMDELGNSIAELVEIHKQVKEEKRNDEKSSMETFVQFGTKKIDSGDYKAAIGIFQNAISEKNSFKYVAYQGLGTAYRYDGQYNLAIEAYQTALKLNKNDLQMKAMSQSSIGLTYLLLGNEFEANKNYIEALNYSKGEHSEETYNYMINAIEKVIQLKGELKGSADILDLLKK